MSIVASTSPPQPALADLTTLIILGIPAVLILLRAGVFRRKSILGPPRVRASDPLGLLLVALIGGAFLWIMVPVLFVSPDQMKAAATAPTSRPAIPPRTLVLASITAAAAAALFMIVANFTLRPTGLRDLGLHPSAIPRGLLAAAIGAIPSIWLVFITVILTQILWQKIGYKHPPEHDLLRYLRQSSQPATSALILISALVAAPIFEELLFRGHLQTLLVHAISKHRLFDTTRGFEVLAVEPINEPLPLSAPIAAPSAAPRWIAIFIASLLFTAVHPFWSWPPIFLLSLCLGYAYERTGNLWVPIFIHTLFNATSTLLFTLQS